MARNAIASAGTRNSLEHCVYMYVSFKWASRRRFVVCLTQNATLLSNCTHFSSVPCFYGYKSFDTFKCETHENRSFRSIFLYVGKITKIPLKKIELHTQLTV